MTNPSDADEPDSFAAAERFLRRFEPRQPRFDSQTIQAAAAAVDPSMPPSKAMRSMDSAPLMRAWLCGAAMGAAAALAGVWFTTDRQTSRASQPPAATDDRHPVPVERVADHPAALAAHGRGAASSSEMLRFRKVILREFQP